MHTLLKKLKCCADSHTFDRFLAIASSTAFNCLSSSSLLEVAFFAFGSLAGGEVAGRFLGSTLETSGLRGPCGFFNVSLILVFSVGALFNASIALTSSAS